MKYFDLLALSIVLFIGLCNAITCDEAKSILNIEYDGNCCDLQQINCDDNNENILSIDSILNFEGEDFDSTDNDLYRRKGGGGRSGGRSGASRTGVVAGAAAAGGVAAAGRSANHHHHSSDGLIAIKANSFFWIVSIIVSFIILN